jgi:hypothetical protein
MVVLKITTLGGVNLVGQNTHTTPASRYHTGSMEQKLQSKNLETKRPSEGHLHNSHLVKSTT